MTSRLPALLAVATAAVLLALQLLVPPVVGLANNGDFEKMMGWVGLRSPAERPEDRYFAYIQPRFALVRPVRDRDGYLSSEIPLAAMARVAAQATSSDGMLDLRLLGAVHMLLLLAAIGLVVVACDRLARPAQWTAAALLVFFFTDVGYAAPLNSLYTQTASLLFLLLTAATASLAIRRGKLDGALLPAYFLCAALFVCSKPQETVHGPLLVAFGIALALPAPERRLPRAAAWAAIFLVAVSLVSFFAAPARLRQQSLYNLVFFELLPHSPEPASDLAALGLDPQWAHYSGSSAYSTGSPFASEDFRATLLERSGYGAVLRLYATKPERLLSTAHRGLASALTLRPEDLGNFAKAVATHPGQKTDRFAVWSRTRERASASAGPLLATLLAGNLLFAAAGYHRASWRGRRIRAGVALLAAMAVLEYVIAVGADGHMEMPRHLFLFQALCDLLLVVDLTWCAHALASRRRLAPAPT